MASHDSAHEAGHLSDSAHGGNGNGGSGNGGHGNGGHGMLATIENRLPAVPSMGWMPGPPRRPEILSAKANPVELLHALRRRWTLAVGLGTVVATLATALVWYFVPVQYEAYALLKVASAPGGVLDKTRSAADEFNTFKRTQVQLILSNIVLQRAVKEKDLLQLSALKEHFDEPVAWLKGKLLIDYPDDSEVLRVAIKAKKPSDAKIIVNKVVEKYLSEIVQEERKLRQTHQRLLEQTHQRYITECKNKEEALHKLEKLSETSSTEAAQMKKRLVIQRLGHLIDEQFQNSTRISMMNMEIALTEYRNDHKAEEAPPDALVDIELGKDPMIARYTETLAGYNEMLTDQVSRTKDPSRNPRIQKLQKNIQRIDELLDERRNALRPRLIEAQLATAVGPSGIRMSLSQMRASKEWTENRMKELGTQIEAETKLLQDLENFNAEAVNMLEELNAKRNITRMLGAALDKIGVEQLAEERIIPLDEAALTNSGGDAVRKYVAMGFTCVFSFGLVLLGVAFIEFQARKVNSVREVHDGLGIHVVGELPSLSGRAWKRLKGAKGSAVLKALIAERIDGARTNLIHTTAIEPPRVIMVTSAVARRQDDDGHTIGRQPGTQRTAHGLDRRRYPQSRCPSGV